MEIDYSDKIEVECVDHMGGDWSIIAAAKVSVDPAEAKRVMEEKDDDGCGLIKYLMRSRHGCFDSETEVLTINGWIPWPKVRGDELFCTLNPNTKEIEYQKAHKTVLGEEYTGPMYKVRGQGVDLLVTSNHNMYVSKKNKEYCQIPAYILGHKRHRYLKNGKWNYKDKEKFSYEELSFLGFSLGDGWLEKDHIRFGLTKERKIRYLIDLCKKLHYKLYEGQSYSVKWPFEFSIYSTEKEKIIPNEILTKHSSQTLFGLLHGLIESDGSIDGEEVKFYSSSKQLMDQIQHLCLHLGTSCNISKNKNLTRFGGKTVYVTNILDNKCLRPEVNRSQSGKTEWVINWEGKIYCVTVPNGILYVRRNGKPVWCGNSPFEQSAISFWVDAPIFVWREFMRHRIGMSYNEESGRWSQLRPKFYIPGRDRPMLTAQDYKPSKPQLEKVIDDLFYYQIIHNMKHLYKESYETYQYFLDNNVAKEVARMVLPVSIFSRCWVTMNPRSLMHFLSLRTHNEAAKYISWPQYEIQVAAEQVENIFKQYWPITYEAFNEYGRVSP